MLELFDGVGQGIIRDMDITVYGCFDARMTEQRLQNFRQHSAFNRTGRIGVPLRYNYDDPEKPRRIKGFEVFSLVFSSFSKPKNHTETSRIIGGVSLTTNE